MRVVAEKGTKVWSSPRSRSRMSKRSLASTTMERPSGVSSASDASWAASASSSSLCAAGREERRGHAVAEGDGAGLVEQQGLHVAGRLDRPAAHGQHVALHQAVHAGDADGRQQGADGGRDEADEQRHQDDHRHRRPGVVAEGLEGHHHGQEHDGEHGQQDGEGDLVGGLLPVGPLHQGDHAVEEGVAPLRGDADHDAVGEDLGPAGDRRAVTAGLADDRAPTRR